MAAFDDLAYSSHAAASPHLARYCPDCEEDVQLSENAAYEYCPVCRGTDLRRVFRGGGADGGNRRDDGSGEVATGSLLRSVLQSVAAHEGVDGIPGAGPGVDIGELLQSMLGDRARDAPPTSEAFLAALRERPLERADFVQALVRGDGLPRDLLATLAEFGPRLGGDAAHARGRVAGLAAAGTGDIAVSRRGGETFVAKARAAEAAGAAALVVSQTPGAVWPYVMTDSAGAGAGLALPAVMLSHEDAETLRECKGVAEVRTRPRGVNCPVCREDFAVGDSAALLPCAHAYHLESCLLPWLQKRSTCPMCRFQLPTDDGGSAAAAAEREHHRAALHGAMFS